jgi:hypothetical protein
MSHVERSINGLDVSRRMLVDNASYPQPPQRLQSNIAKLVGEERDKGNKHIG